MSSKSVQTNDEHLQAQRCWQGDSTALADLRQRCHNALASILLARGASSTEAQDLLADLWADCVPGNDERPSLLEKFSGKCSLQAWLATVSTNRLIDLKRKQKRRGEGMAPNEKAGQTTFIGRVPAPVSTTPESGLTELLRDSLQKAFGACSAEGLLMLRLVFLYGLSQREVAGLWACHESKVSRMLNQALPDIQARTLKEIKTRDPWLDLNWEDFVDMCQTQQIGFL